MKHSIFELLEKTGLVRGKTVNKERVAAAESKKLIEVIENVSELTKLEGLHRKPSAYTFTSSISLGGGRVSCAGRSCRLNKASELAQFAALYADKVYIHNVLEDNIHGGRHHDSAYLDEINLQVYNDLLVLATLRPLIESGNVELVTLPGNVCPGCLAKKSFGDKADMRAKKEFMKLSSDIFSSTSFEFAMDDEDHDGESFCLSFSGSDEIFDHGGSGCMFLRSIPPMLDSSSTRRTLSKKRKFTLSQRQVRSIGIHKYLAKKLFENVVFELGTSQCLNTRFLVERPIYGKILSRISMDKKILDRNNIIQQHLQVMVPFLNDVPTDSLLKLRKREAGAFLQFRNAMNRAVDDSRAISGSFTAKEAMAVYGDVIEPELYRMKASLKRSKRDLVIHSAYKTGAWAGAISFGMFAGFLPQEIAALAQALGLTGVVQEIGESMLNLTGTNRIIEENDMYFLWRVKKLAKK